MVDCQFNYWHQVRKTHTELPQTMRSSFGPNPLIDSSFPPT